MNEMIVCRNCGLSTDGFDNMELGVPLDRVLLGERTSGYVVFEFELLPVEDRRADLDCEVCGDAGARWVARWEGERIVPVTF